MRSSASCAIRPKDVDLANRVVFLHRTKYDKPRNVELSALALEALEGLDVAYRSGLRGCRYTTFVTTHEAFGYLADQYGLHQLGGPSLVARANAGLRCPAIDGHGVRQSAAMLD